MDIVMQSHEILFSQIFILQLLHSKHYGKHRKYMYECFYLCLYLRNSLYNKKIDKNFTMQCDEYCSTGVWEKYNENLDKEVISSGIRRFSSAQSFCIKNNQSKKRNTYLFIKSTEELLCKYSFYLNKPNLTEVDNPDYIFSSVLSESQHKKAMITFTLICHFHICHCFCNY